MLCWVCSHCLVTALTTANAHEVPGSYQPWSQRSSAAWLLSYLASPLDPWGSKCIFQDLIPLQLKGLLVTWVDFHLNKLGRRPYSNCSQRCCTLIDQGFHLEFDFRSSAHGRFRWCLPESFRSISYLCSRPQVGHRRFWHYASRRFRTLLAFVWKWKGRLCFLAANWSCRYFLSSIHLAQNLDDQQTTLYP